LLNDGIPIVHKPIFLFLYCIKPHSKFEILILKSSFVSLEENMRDHNRQPIMRAQIIMGIVMGLVYVCLGLLFIFYKPFLVQFTPMQKLLAGAFLILYGLFRFYRVYNIYTKE